MNFASYSPAQIRAHCQSNARSLMLNPTAYQAQRQGSLARAQRLRGQLDEEIQAFRTWRTGFLVPRRDPEGSPRQAYEKRLPHARQQLFGLHVTWAALSPLLTEDERARLLKTLIEPSPPSGNEGNM
jgi:hypothetical protein